MNGCAMELVFIAVLVCVREKIVWFDKITRLDILFQLEQKLKLQGHFY